MKKNGLLVFMLYILLVGDKIVAQPCREIIGYFPAWQWYDRQQLVNPQTIHYDRYSIINYAFFKPKPDGTIEGTDAWADENILEGQINWQTTPKSHYPNTSLVDLAHAAGVKVLISIGGWAESRHFSTIAAQDVTRQKFVEACQGLIEKYNLDGIDIDWEYPGYKERGGSPDDKNNFTKLIKGIRQNLDDLTIKTNKNYLLTAAFSASADNMMHIDWAAVTPSLSSINLMTYDFEGTWSDKTGHNAPLYATNEACVDAAVTRLINTYNVPVSKICMGIAFYGRSMKTPIAPILRGPLNGKADKKTFKQDDGAPLYYNILAKKKLFTEYWDSIAQVPFLLGKKNLKTFLSYDDEKSVTIKAQYIVNKKLRGTILWDLTGDYLESPQNGITTPLLDAINTIFDLSDTTIIQDTFFQNPRPENPNTFQKGNDLLLQETSKTDTIIPTLTNASSNKFSDFDIIDEKAIPLAIAFRLKQNRAVFIHIKNMEGQILRGMDCGVLKQGSHTVALKSLIDALPTTEYLIELLLPAYEIIPEEKCIKKWYKNL
jgi:chitinase